MCKTCNASITTGASVQLAKDGSLAAFELHVLPLEVRSRLPPSPLLRLKMWRKFIFTRSPDTGCS